MIIHIGWWIAPLLISVGAIVIALICGQGDSSDGYGAIGDGIVGCFSILLALVVSLMAWLGWALL